MKKLALLFVAVTLVLASCSKERKLNKRLDGEWTLATWDGTALPSGESLTIKFEKDKKDNGKYTSTYTGALGTDIETGTYTLEADEKITMTDASGSSTATVTSYDKENLTINDDGDVMVFKKK